MYIESFVALGITGGFGFCILWIGLFIFSVYRYIQNFGKIGATCFAAFFFLFALYGFIESSFVSGYVMYQLSFFTLGVYLFISDVEHDSTQLRSHYRNARY